MVFAEKTCSQMVEALAAKVPVPGGGGAAALVGAVGIALGNMVGSFTQGKKKFSHVEEDIIALQEKCNLLQSKFLHLIDADAANFEPLAKAYALKEGTEEEALQKEKIMAEALKTASAVPLEIMELCCEAIDILEAYLEKGNPMLVSDVGVGVLCCKAALFGASLNIYINTKAMTDVVYAQELNEKTEHMLLQYGKKAEDTYEEVKRKIS